MMKVLRLKNLFKNVLFDKYLHRTMSTEHQLDPYNNIPRAGGALKMFAWQIHSYGELSELKLCEARVPAIRAPDELLVRVEAASINPLDLAMIGGYGSGVLNVLRCTIGRGDGDGVEFPLTLGRDFVGVVERTGTQARSLLGRRVWGVVPPHWQGSHAQYLVAKHQWVDIAPEKSSCEAGGALYAALSAYSAISAGGLVMGCGGGGRRKRVLLLGVGGVGAAALQLLKYFGAHVVVGCSKDAIELAIALGADAALDRSDPSYYQKLEQHGRYEVILDCAGLGGEGAVKLGAHCSIYVTLSSPLLRECDSRGVLLGTASGAFKLLRENMQSDCQVRWAYFTPSKRAIKMVGQLIDKGQYCVLLEGVYPWRDAAKAFDRASKKHLRGKLVLDFTNDTIL